MDKRDYIRMIRIYLNLTQDELAARMGVTSATIQRYEKHNLILSHKLWMALLMVFFKRAQSLYVRIENSPMDVYRPTTRSWVRSLYWRVVDGVIFNNDFTWFENHKEYFDKFRGLTKCTDPCVGERIYTEIEEKEGLLNA